MSSNSGQISVNIALIGADSFGTSVDGVSGKLHTLEQNAGTAGTGVSGLGTNAQGATTGVNALGDGSASTGTKMLAVGGAISSVAGGVIGLVGNYEDLTRAGTTVDRMNKNVELATQLHEKAVDALNKIVKTGTVTAADYEKAQQKVADAEKKVGDDQTKIADDMAKLNDLRAKGKEGTQAYADALHKLGDDQATLKTDQDKLGDSQKAYSDLVQHHVDVTSPAYIEAVQRVKSSEDALKVAKDRAKEAQDALNLSHIRFAENIAQTVLQATGQIVTSIALFTGGTKTAVQGMQGMESEAQSMPLKMGVIGIVLTVVAGLLLAIATNFMGIRTAIQDFADQVVKANPWLKPFVDLIGALADNLGLTGKGFMQNTGAIPKAIKEIYDQIKATPIGQALADLTTAIKNFFTNPFGSTTTTPDYGLNINQPQGAPGSQFLPSGQLTQQQVKDNLPTSPGYGASTTNNLDQLGLSAQKLGTALLDALKQGFQYVITNLPKAIKAVGDAIISTLAAAMPSMDDVGSKMIDGLDAYFTGKGTGKGGSASDKVSKAFWDMVFNAITGASAGDAAQRAIGGMVDTLIISLGKGLQNSKTKTSLTNALMDFLFGDLGKDVTRIFGPLFDIKNWTAVGKTALATLQSILTFDPSKIGTTLTAIFGPLFDVKNWATLAKTAIATLTSVLTFDASKISSVLTTIFGPLFDFKNWTALAKTAVATLESALTFDPAKIITVISNVFGPLFDFKNWTAVAKTAIASLQSALTFDPSKITTVLTTIIGPLFDFKNWTALAKTAIASLTSALTFDPSKITATLTTIFGPLFNFANWGTATTGLIGSAQTSIVKALTVLATDVTKIFAALSDATAWQTIGGKIADALKQALINGVNAAIALVNQGLAAAHLPPIPLIGGQQQQQPYGQQQQQPFSPTTGNSLTNPQTGRAFGAPALFTPNAPVNTAAAYYAPNAPVNTVPITVLVTIDGKNVATSLKPYMLGGSGALT